MVVVEQRDQDVVPLLAACEALGVSRASLYRSRQPARDVTREPSHRVLAPSPRRLSDEERQHLLDIFHSPEFVDQPPTEVYATLLGRGV